MVTLSGHKDAIVGIAWMPNSDKNVVTVSWDHTIMIWDLELAGELFIQFLVSFYLFFSYNESLIYLINLKLYRIRTI